MLSPWVLVVNISFLEWLFGFLESLLAVFLGDGCFSEGLHELDCFV